MRTKSFVARTPFALTGALAVCLISAGVTLTLAQGGRSSQPTLSSEEQSMLKAIMSATDPVAKFKAVDVLIKKHPKTPVRERIAREAANQIGDLKDATQKVTLSQQYAALFTEPSEQQMIMPILIEGLAGAGKVDEAFSSATRTRYLYWSNWYRLAPTRLSRRTQNSFRKACSTEPMRSS